MNDTENGIMHKMYDSLKDMVAFSAKAEEHLKGIQIIKEDVVKLSKEIQQNKEEVANLNRLVQQKNEQISHIKSRLDDMDLRFKNTSTVYKEELEVIKKATTNIKSEVVETEKK